MTRLLFAAILLVWPAAAFGAQPRIFSRAAQLEGTCSPVVQQEAIKSIPLDKLTPEGRAKAAGVLSNVTLFRRMPVRVIDCDPELYLFLVRNPDVVVNIWEVLKISQLHLRQTGPNQYRLVEPEGTTVNFEYLYRTHDTHIVYAEGAYTGRLLQREVKAKGLLVLKSGYVHETDGRYYITNRLDAFLSVEPGAVELVTKTLQPLLVKVGDNNFTQSVAFLSSLSRTAEANSRAVQNLAGKLTGVQPELRKKLADLAENIAARSKTAAVPAAASTLLPLVAAQD